MHFGETWTNFKDMIDQWLRGFGRLLQLCLVLMVVYFGQVYPYAHVHHSHADSEHSIEFSLHPINIEPFCVDDYHLHEMEHSGEENEHHQHHESEQNVEWHARRITASIVLPSSDVDCVEEVVEDADTQKSAVSFIQTRIIPPPELIFSEGIDSRGPPTTV